MKILNNTTWSDVRDRLIFVALVATIAYILFLVVAAVWKVVVAGVVILALIDYISRTADNRRTK